MKKRIVTLLVAVLLVVASVIPAFAADGDSPSSGFNFGQTLLVSLGIGLVVAVIVILVLWSQLKSVHFQSGAAEYIKNGSMKVTGSYEHFLYSTVTKIKIPKNDK